MDIRRHATEYCCRGQAVYELGAEYAVWTLQGDDKGLFALSFATDSRHITPDKQHVYASKRQFGLQLDYKACNGLFCWCREGESTT